MTKTIQIDPVTRIEGHAKVFIEVGDDNKVASASMNVLEFRGFEKFLSGMQVELMPTIVTRICGTCPHAHHLAAAKALDAVFGATPPRAAVLLRELLNMGSVIHSHAIHFFLLAGPDLLLGVDSPAAKRNVLGLMEAAPDLATKALRLRTLGQRIAETVGGRGTHPITAVAGGMSAGVDKDAQASLKAMADEALALAKVLVNEGKKALLKNKELLSILKIPAVNFATVKGGKLDLFDGILRARKADGAVATEFPIADYREHLSEEASANSYTKAVFLAETPGVPMRVGPLARINCAESVDTPLAEAELANFKAKLGNPCNYTPMAHFARLIELLYCTEKAVQLASDPEIGSSNLRAQLASPKSAIAHVEAPRGTLIHEYEVDANGIVKSANFLVATQLNAALINASLRGAAEQFWGKPDDELINGVEYAIRCHDPCLSCSTHQVGRMPIEIVITRDGRETRRARR